MSRTIHEFISAKFRAKRATICLLESERISWSRTPSATGAPPMREQLAHSSVRRSQLITYKSGRHNVGRLRLCLREYIYQRVRRGVFVGAILHIGGVIGEWGGLRGGDSTGGDRVYRGHQWRIRVPIELRTMSNVEGSGSRMIENLHVKKCVKKLQQWK